MYAIHATLHRTFVRPKIRTIEQVLRTTNQNQAYYETDRHPAFCVYATDQRKRLIPGSDPFLQRHAIATGFKYH